MMKPSSPLHQVTKYAGPAICALAALVAFAVAHRVIGGPLFPNDDAFINLHNAQVLWLEAIDPEQAKIVELRYFMGLGIEETASVLGISPATLKRRWALARAWLFRELSGSKQ